MGGVTGDKGGGDLCVGRTVRAGDWMVVGTGEPGRQSFLTVLQAAHSLCLINVSGLC